ncbi:hypothetical protein [Kitasatospora viridis]|uniref:Uncharacterized protein n=1 Tax=Kitasatospora viridis TaxID=281105 RepID=A0A561UEX6_9ACTN|nr:hypothetical protein [Kitasatospora viridis]TWF97914.1 hypothetical protein FHX73_111716 [Kitasatospora viridis]
MRIRTAVIGFALASMAVVGAAGSASAHGHDAWFAKGYHHTGSVMAGKGQVSETHDNEGGSEGGVSGN